MIKESQEEIIELSAPFKKLFESAIEKTKEDIAQRNLRTKVKNSKGNLNAQQNSQMLYQQMESQMSGSQSGAEMVKSQSRSKLEAPIDPKQIQFSQFTESDKRNVIQKFLVSHEVLFLVYGLMFPSQTIAAANQALTNQFYAENITN